MAVRKKRVETLAAEVLRRSGVLRPPVPIEEIVRKHGLHIRRQPLESNLSGFLYRDAMHPVVGVNSSHAPVRQRFTLGHELGHFLLHESHKLRVDRSVHARLTSGSGDERPIADDDETEANLFAAAILMPAEFLRQQVDASNSVDILDDEQFITKLARGYNVSAQALLLRLVQLGYVRQ
jgi:Zn-dependent peptidase ImmA (M78 family)